MLFSHKNRSGYIVLTSMLLVSALITVTTLTTLYHGTQFLRVASKKNAKQRAYFLAQACAEIGLKEIIDEVTPLAVYGDGKAGFYELTDLELDYSGEQTITAYTPAANNYCWLSYATTDFKKAIYAAGVSGGESSKLTSILDHNNNLIYQNPGITPPL